MYENNWTIAGDDSLAAALRETSQFVPTEKGITIATAPAMLSESDWVVGPAVLSALRGRYVPYYAAFEAIEEIWREVRAGATGKVYGVFGSFRVSRDLSAADVPFNALLPILGLTLDIISDPVVRVWATNPGLMTAGDAWFVHLRTAGEILITLEAMACCDPATGSELLVEVTGHDRVLRAEPMRQAVIVEPIGAPAATHPWWEDLNERFLKLVIERAQQADDAAGSRLRIVWDAIQRSSGSGAPISL